MDQGEITEASRYLRQLAEGIARAYVAHPSARAAIVMGSAADGQSDFYSDLDMAVYYDTLPTEEELQTAAHTNGATDWKPLGARDAGMAAESYVVQGVECQIVHATIAAWERDMASVLEQHDVTSPLQKALSGMLEALPLYGAPLIRRWQEQIAAYPDALALAMVERHLSFFPVWALRERFMTATPRSGSIRLQSRPSTAFWLSWPVSTGSITPASSSSVCAGSSRS